MTVSKAVLALVAGLLAAMVGAAPDASVRVVEVKFVQPDRFADVGDRAIPRSRETLLEELREHLVRHAAPRLAPDQRLSVSITYVDMAGQFEPWRPRLGDARIIRDVYPPRIDLAFTVTDASGAIVKRDERQLRDLAFLMTIVRYPGDRLRYEKALIDSWLERDFPRAH